MLNSHFSPKDIAHIMMGCGVHWKVGDIYAHVPGTNIEWNFLISRSIIFPHRDNCYLLPFWLLWNAKAPQGRTQENIRQQ